MKLRPLWKSDESDFKIILLKQANFLHK